jgi:hypothetical protein
MNCQGGGLYRQFLIGEISKYLHWKGAKSCKEKEMHTGIFLDSNEKNLEKEFCCQKCPFRKDCQQKK